VRQFLTDRHLSRHGRLRQVQELGRHGHRWCWTSPAGRGMVGPTGPPPPARGGGMLRGLARHFPEN
jgi:hypothetical protein